MISDFPTGTKCSSLFGLNLKNKPMDPIWLMLARNRLPVCPLGLPFMTRSFFHLWMDTLKTAVLAALRKAPLFFMDRHTLP